MHVDDQTMLEVRAGLALHASQRRRKRAAREKERVRRQRRLARPLAGVGLCLGAWLTVNAQPTAWHAVLLLVAVGLCCWYLATLWWFERL